MPTGIIQKYLRRGRLANRLALALFAALTAILLVSFVAGVSTLASA